MGTVQRMRKGSDHVSTGDRAFNACIKCKEQEQTPSEMEICSCALESRSGPVR